MSITDKLLHKETHDIIQENLNDLKRDYANYPNTTNGDMVILEILSRLYLLIKELETDLKAVSDYQDKIVEWGHFY